MQKITKLFVGAFIAQGAGVLVEVLCWPGHGAKGFNEARNLTDGVMMLLALALYIAMILTPKLAKRILLPLTVFILWTACGAFPLSLFYPANLELILGAIQCALGLGIYFVFVQRSPWGWDLLDFTNRRPSFSFKNFIGSIAYTALLAVGFVGLFLHAGACIIESKTGGYVRVGTGGVAMEERRFQKASKEVRLVGMIHIARSTFYEEISQSIPANTPALVLMEGITDREHLLKKSFGYSNLARALGLTSQADSTFHKRAVAGAIASDEELESDPFMETGDELIRYRSSDIDVAAFQTNTLHFLQAIGALMASTTFTEVIKHLEDPNSPLADEANGPAVMHDILDIRNQHLIGKIQNALTESDLIVVPWGAMHLPVIQTQLEEWGFVESTRIRRHAFHFRNQKTPTAQP